MWNINHIYNYLTTQVHKCQTHSFNYLIALSTSGATTDTDKETHLTGIYDLVAVLTHKGRSADSGHYVAWVKQESGKFFG